MPKFLSEKYHLTSYRGKCKHLQGVVASQNSDSDGKIKLLLATFFEWMKSGV